MRRLVQLAALARLLTHADAFCCAPTSADPTFEDKTERYLTAITPNRGTIGGGTKVFVTGGGFNVNFFTGGNYVYIGSDATEWTPCDVIEGRTEITNFCPPSPLSIVRIPNDDNLIRIDPSRSFLLFCAPGACSVDCGGPKRIVCETQEWTHETSRRTNSGWLDVKVMIEILGDYGANEMVELVLSRAFYYYGTSHMNNPMLLGVSPHAASSEEAIMMTGKNFGFWIQDYRMVYVGKGRAPQGGNVVTSGSSTISIEPTHTQCRPGSLNSIRDPLRPDTPPVTTAAVMKEDRNPAPIAFDTYQCALGDFPAGSYNVSVYMSNGQRTLGGSQDTGTHVGGLAVVYDEDGYLEPGLFNRDSKGTLHMVQYYPRIDSVFPPAGSLGGNTVVTITGGGFPMNEEEVAVAVAGRPCVVSYASIESIICNTTAKGNSTVFTKVSVGDHGAVGVADVWMAPSDTVGSWDTISSASAEGGSYLGWADQASPGEAWVTFSPSGGSVGTSGIYEFLLGLPASDASCWPRHVNASVIIRSGSGYTSIPVDMSQGGAAGGYAMLGNFTLVAGATTFVTIDTTGSNSCIAADTVLLRFQEPVSVGCTDPDAENYDADVMFDDGSCLYLGGRGVSMASWSAMADPYSIDDWYPQEEFEVWGTGGFCEVPSNATDEALAECLHGNCEYHGQCGVSSFCCISDKHNGCTPVREFKGVDASGWKLVFRHDMKVAGPWVHGQFATNGTDGHGDLSAFSLLADLEEFRRPSDGRFEFRACWPGSGFKSCMEWIQLRNPMANPDLTNTYATCLKCPYTSDVSPDGEGAFYGLQYDGETHLLDGDSDGSYFQIGSESTDKTMNGPQLRNDAGEIEYPSVIAVYVRPDTNGPACIDCKACYDKDGAVNMALYTGSDGVAYSKPACPDYCLDAVSPKPRDMPPLLATHHLVAATDGLAEKPCYQVKSTLSVNNTAINTTVCEGMEIDHADQVPETMAFGRTGGSRARAFFVAPETGTYTFNTRFNDGGELWLSPNADPRSAERIIAVSSGTSSGAGSDGSMDSAFCDGWSCVGGRCFQRFLGYFNPENSAMACSKYGARLAAPRNAAEAALVSGTGWLGINDKGTEGTFYYSDGTLAGVASRDGTLSGWSYEKFHSGEPNDYSNTENCIEQDSYGNWNDATCEQGRRFFCEIDMPSGCGHSARSSAAISMEKGDVRYLELLGFNNEGTDLSLLTLSFTGENGESWTTSDVLGLSAEFLREIRHDKPSLSVVVNELSAACGPESGECAFTYSTELTPTVEAIEPAVGYAGTTAVTISGTGFSAHPLLNEVDFGGAPCVVSSCNTTFIVCTVPAEQGMAGTFDPVVNVFNKGRALVPWGVTHTIKMQITSVSPMGGSLYGGMTLTLTGSGFANFGLHNQIKLLLRNDTKEPGAVVPERPPTSLYDDDWLWQRGPSGAGRLNDTDPAPSYSAVLCVPKTLRNRACRVTEDDAGYACSTQLAWAYDDVSTRGYAHW